MSEYLPFIVIGITTGSIYGLAAVGLTLTYKTSGIFNFAYGSVAAVGVFVFYFLHVQHDWPWPLAALLCLLVLGPLMGLGLEVFARLLQHSTDAVKTAATVGLILIVDALGVVWYQNIQSPVPPFLPTSTVRILGTNVSWGEIVTVIVALAATLALFWLFRSTRLGFAMRGVVDDPDLMAITGESPARIRRWAWVIGSVFATLAGLLLAPSLNLSATVLTLLVVQAFGAAAVGYFSSLPLAYAGGLLLGVAAALSTKFVVQVPALAGLPPSLPFIALFVVLIVTPRAKLSRHRFVPFKATREPWYAPMPARLVAGLIACAALALVPFLVGTQLSVWSSALIAAIIFLSLGLLVRLSGQISLCQYAFAAIGAAAMGHFTTGFGLPWPVALLLAGLVAVPIGAVVAIPAIRLTGVFLALATLGFGIMLEQLFYTTNIMFGSTTSGIPTTRPNLFGLGTDRGFYYVILGALVLSAALVTVIRQGRLGRILGAMSESPLALETQGLPTNVTKLLIFCISAFMAGIAGALTASLFGFAVGSDFSSFGSLTLIVLVVIVPLGDPWYALVAAASLQILPAYITFSNFPSYLALLFGWSAVFAPYSLDRTPPAPRWLRRIAYGISNRPDPKEEAAARTETVPPTLVVVKGEPLTTSTSTLPTPTLAGVGLSVESISVSYGGALAVDALSLQAPLGRITGLIGPNGAGKTSTFNVASGLVSPQKGKVRLNGEVISTFTPAKRARMGLGRTFQRVELFNSLTVRENIGFGREGGMVGANAVRQVHGSRAHKRIIEDAVEDAARLVGATPFLDLRAGDLSTGHKRLVELARALAGTFDVIMLDEPSSGLDNDETSHFGEILSHVVSERGIGILLVEHDMSLVRQVCNDVYVMDFGKLIFTGSCEEMLRDDTVRAAYLGSDDASLAAELLPTDERA
jgi:ABC-type branched-subunit amino acid transport system ATPase component/branched-subunit amino acid ABC-type transport system permease component